MILEDLTTYLRISILPNDSFLVNSCSRIFALFIFDLLDATIFLPNSRGPNVLVNMMSTNEWIRIEKIQTGANRNLYCNFHE